MGPAEVTEKRYKNGKYIDGTRTRHESGTFTGLIRLFIAVMGASTTKVISRT